MTDAGASDWQQRYDRSISAEKSKKAKPAVSEPKWHLLDTLSYTGTALDLLLLPVAIAILGVAAFRRLRKRN